MVFVSSVSVWSDDDHLPAVCSNLRHYLDAGGRVALGTDAPAFQEPGLPAKEITRLIDCGLSSMEVLVAATSSAAHYVGKGNELVTIRAGFLADLLVVDGDPLANLSALSRVGTVILDGEVVTRP